MIRLNRGPFVLDLAPEVGGGIARFTINGVDILRPAPEGAAPQVLDLGCFPLVPFANRIAHGRFVFGGREVQLSPNMGDHPHALHGQGWLSPWTVAEAGSGRAVLQFEYAGGEWPWPYRAEQTVELTDQGARLSLAMTNLSDEPAPAGLGFHPYFPGRSQARLTARLDGAWAIDADCLAVGDAPGPLLADWTRGAPLAQPQLIDHCHTGWDGQARIDMAGLSLRLSASPELSCLHLYSPPGEVFFCAEPVSHRPDAANAPDPAGEGMARLPPSGRMSVSLGLDVAVT